MKSFALSALLLFSVVSFVSCKKDSNNTTASSETFTGKWTGKYGFGAETPNNFFSLNIKPDGEIQELNSSGVAKGKGNWTVQGKTLKGTYKMLFSPFNEYSVLVTVNTEGKMQGSWGYDSNGTDGGLLTLSKQ